MGLKNKEYISIFKLNGVPILPPLMTTEKRLEMQNYREIAKLIEISRLSSNKSNRSPNAIARPLTITSASDTESQLTIDSYLKVSNILKYANDNNKTYSTLNLTKSETLIYDLLQNSLTTSNPTCILKENSLPICISSQDNLINATPIDVAEQLPIIQVNEPEKCQNILTTVPLNLTSVPTISIVPATPVVQSKPIVDEILSIDESSVSDSTDVHVVIQRSTTSLSLVSETRPDVALIRSNSFTLENPSKALLQHLKNQKSKFCRKVPSTATKDTVESNAKKVKKVIKTPSFVNKSAQKNKSVSSCNLNMKNRRSPYESKVVSSKMKLKKQKSPTGFIIKTKASRSSLLRKDSINNNSCQEISSSDKFDSPIENTPLKTIADQHKDKLMKLIESQKEEQKRLQDTFAEQQSKLMEQLTSEIKNATISTEKLDSITTIERKPLETPTPRKPTESTKKLFCTPRRQLFPKENSPVKVVQKESALNKRRSLAATKINAFVRGYLTRRLFKTDYVQRVVQTIRDTLIFVLDLHMETDGLDESEENTRLKARLLQQLLSACNCLHRIFFELTTKDRLAMIAKDRKYIKTKMSNFIMSSRRS